MGTLGEVLGSLILLVSIGSILYAFYRMFKYMINGIKDNDD